MADSFKEISFSYMNKAIIIVWGMIFGLILFNEKIKINMIIGAIIIFIGIWEVIRDYE